MKKLRLVAINLLVLLGMLVVVELIFGSWIFQRNSLNHINVISDQVITYNIEDLYESEDPMVTYSRDEYGLRGTSAFNKPEEIDILTVGGSTTDQVLITDGLTWQDVLEQGLKEQGYDLNLSNGGLDGQSTYGHIRNFDLWYPHIPGLKPKFIMYYVGINDFFREDKTIRSDIIYKDSIDRPEDVGFLKSIKYQIEDKSALYHLRRKVLGLMTAHKRSVLHNKIDFASQKYVTEGNLDSVQMEAYLQGRVSTYRNRLRTLVGLSKDLGATPIFITQPSVKYQYGPNGQILGVEEAEAYGDFEINGIDYFNLLTRMNQEVYNVSVEENVPFIELTKRDIWEYEDFYDWFHMTPAGAKKLGEVLTDELTKRILPVYID